MTLRHKRAKYLCTETLYENVGDSCNTASIFYWHYVEYILLKAPRHHQSRTLFLYVFYPLSINNKWHVIRSKQCAHYVYSPVNGSRNKFLCTYSCASIITVLSAKTARLVVCNFITQHSATRLMTIYRLDPLSYPHQLLQASDRSPWFNHLRCKLRLSSQKKNFAASETRALRQTGLAIYNGPRWNSSTGRPYLNIPVPVRVSHW